MSTILGGFIAAASGSSVITGATVGGLPGIPVALAQAHNWYEQRENAEIYESQWKNIENFGDAGFDPEVVRTMQHISTAETNRLIGSGVEEGSDLFNRRMNNFMNTLTETIYQASYGGNDAFTKFIESPQANERALNYVNQAFDIDRTEGEGADRVDIDEDFATLIIKAIANEMKDDGRVFTGENILQRTSRQAIIENLSITVNNGPGPSTVSIDNNTARNDDAPVASGTPFVRAR